MKTSLTVVFALYLVGCVGCAGNKFIHGSGDVGQYVLQQSIAQGGRPVSTNSLPVLGSEWSYYQDENGVAVHLPREQFPAVADFLRQAYGEPSMPVKSSANGRTMGIYDTENIGVGILFGINDGRDKNDAYILIVPGISMGELIKHRQEVNQAHSIQDGVKFPPMEPASPAP